MELTTAANQRPITFPVTPYIDPDRDVVVTSSPIAFSEKLGHIRENPMVSMRLYQPSEQLVVRGKAEIRDDLDPSEASNHLMELTFKQRPTEKARFFEYVADSMTSRYGEYMRDWYALRRIIEITPTQVGALDDSEDPVIQRWSAAGLTAEEARRYTYGSLGFLAEDGKPLTIPIAGVNGQEGEGYIELFEETGPGVGDRVCILLHWHRFDLSDLGQRVVRGTVTDRDDSLVISVGGSYRHWNESWLDDLVFNIRGKWRTARYFGERNPLRWRW